MITFSSLINIIFFSSMAIILLKCVFRNNNAVLRLDIRFLLVCMLFILTRLFIPIESPVTNSIPVGGIYPAVYMFLKKQLVPGNPFEISIMSIFQGIWILGTMTAAVRVAYSYLKIAGQMRRFPVLNKREASEALQKINESRSWPVPFKLVTTDAACTPFVFGIIRPYIAIPSIPLTEKDIYFILKHETTHYYRGDMLIRLFCEILKAVYWWNPFIYMLCRLVEEMQEINVDFKVIRELPELEQLDYSECLVKVAKIREKQKKENRWVLAFQKESPSAIHKRISLMLGNLDISKEKTVTSILLSVIILSLVLLCPNILIFEPYSIPKEDAAGSLGSNDGKLYYLKNQNSTYSLYLDGQYVATVIEIVADEKVQVYDNLEEVEK